jgi:hypothetical protein
MTLVLDTGALVGLERNDRTMWRRLKSALLMGQVPITHGGVIGQAWRGHGPRSALLAKALSGIDVRAIDNDLGKRAGELLARAKTTDVIDAALVLIASDHDTLLTSDPTDMKRLADAADRLIDLIHV